MLYMIKPLEWKPNTIYRDCLYSACTILGTVFVSQVEADVKSELRYYWILRDSDEIRRYSSSVEEAIKSFTEQYEALLKSALTETALI